MRLGALVLALLSATSATTLGSLARAETPSIWQRAQPGASQEAELGAALDRALEGYADERDLLRVRAALVELGQGRAPRRADVLVLLVHFRLELAFDGPRRGGIARAPWAGWLERALESASLSAELRSLALRELGRLARAEGEPGRPWFERALAGAVDERRRAGLELLLGGEVLAASRGGRDALLRAERAFSAVQTSAAGGRLRAAGWVGSALVAAARGDEREAASSARAAAAEWASGASASGASWAGALSLQPVEQAYWEAVLARGRALAVVARSAPDEPPASSDRDVPSREEERACELAAALPEAHEERLAGLEPARRWLLQSCAPGKPSSATQPSAPGKPSSATQPSAPDRASPSPALD